MRNYVCVYNTYVHVCVYLAVSFKSLRLYSSWFEYHIHCWLQRIINDLSGVCFLLIRIWMYHDVSIESYMFNLLPQVQWCPGGWTKGTCFSWLCSCGRAQISCVRTPPLSPVKERGETPYRALHVLARLQGGKTIHDWYVQVLLINGIGTHTAKTCTHT